MLLFAPVLNVFSLVFNIYVIAWCPYHHCGYIDVATSNYSSDNNSLSLTPDSRDKFDDFQKFVFTSASLSGLVSYLCITFVLYSQYSKVGCCCTKAKKGLSLMWKACDQINGVDSIDKNEGKDQDEIIVLNPFYDDEIKGLDRKFKSTPLKSRQSCYYYFVFYFNIILFSSSVVIFFWLFRARLDYSDKSVKHYIDIIGLTCQFYSWFCATLSCFIFSKVAYAIVNICDTHLFACFDHIANQTKKNLKCLEVESVLPNLMDKYWRDKTQFKDDFKKSHSSYIDCLKVIDKWYTDTVKSSLHPYGTWFAFHWLLYTLTAFLSIAYVTEAALMELYGKEKSDLECHGEHNTKCQMTLAYIITFSANHCILFLYPCFRAASVTAARYTLIKKVSSATWPKVPIAQKQLFVQYLKDQDCTFKVSILCAKLSFGFNVAYFSIFVGIMSVVLKVSL